MRNLIFLLAVLFTSHAAAQVQWLPPSDNDLVPSAIVGAEHAPAPPSLNTAREPANFAWMLDFGDQPAELTGMSGYSADSRQYWLDHTAGDLARGVELPLSAAGALVRISILDAGSRASRAHTDGTSAVPGGLDASRLQLRMNGRALSTDAVEFSASGADLRNAGMEVPERTLGFRLDKSAGAGLLHLALDTALPAQTPVVVHVFEPESEIVANLSVPRMHYLAGERIMLRVDLNNAGRAIPAHDVQAVLTSPDLAGSVRLDTSRGGGELAARLPDNPEITPGLPWEARVYLEAEVDGMKVLRDVQVAFNLALPVARLTGDAALAETDNPAIEVGVEAAQAGRFQLSGILYGTGRSGGMQPVAMAQGAAWLDPGRHRLPLSFDGIDLTKSGVGAPWEIRDLRLTDQGRMGLMQRVEGLRLAE